MTPTPPARSSFSDNFRFGRPRRQRDVNPFDSSNHATPTHATQPVSPLEDEGAGEDSDEEHEEGHEDDREAVDEDEEEGDLEEEGEEGEEEEEGGIEEDLLSLRPLASPMPPTVRDLLAQATTRRRVPLFPDLASDRNNFLQWVIDRLTDRAPVPPIVPMDVDPPFDPTSLGLKEIGNLASWTVSSCKPGCGVEALRDEDVKLFWQSDGPQPHHLNIHFSRLVCIRAIRIYLDFEADESYTPTRITLFAGTGYHDLIPFSDLQFAQPKGWIDVGLEHVGGGEDGKTLRAFLVQVRVMENHQNGKDTHVRGLKIYAKDERVAGGGLGTLGGLDGERVKLKKGAFVGEERGYLTEPDWMGEPELR